MSEIRHAPTATTGTRVLASGARIDPHRHDENQVVYAGSGVLSVSTDAGTWVTPADRAIWIPAGSTHAHRAYGISTLHTVGLPASARPIPTTGPAVLAVGPLLRELLIAYTATPQPAGPARRRMQAVLLDQLRIAPERPLHLPAPNDVRLQRIAELFERHPAAPQSLAQLAELVNTSPRTLSRLYRDELGMTFPQWRTQTRLHQALRLLSDGKSVSTVAVECGWATPSAFIDVYRRNFGDTPGGRRPRHHTLRDRCSRAATPVSQCRVALSR